MKQVVIMPGGFHPFHAGHYALYKQAQDAFPSADVYVAATNDTSSRPFPFAVKEKLARLAGVAPGHFVQVKSPFQAREITANLDPENTQLIFVRSQKDADKPPQAGGVKKDGQPAYLQLLKGQADLAPMSKHAYMAYLPTVEFGPGMTSATEIRTAWPTLNEKRKTALVMSLYPATQKNPALAANVVKMLDSAMGTESVDEAISRRGFLKGAGAAAAAGAAGKAGAIAGAFPTPSHQAAMYKAAADSNAAEARRQAELKRQADAERLRKNTELVDKEQRVNHHKLDESGNEYILYINDKPAAKYNDVRQAEQDLVLIKSKVPTAKFEIKQEVCNMVAVPVGLKEALLREFVGNEKDFGGKPAIKAKYQHGQDFLVNVNGHQYSYTVTNMEAQGENPVLFNIANHLMMDVNDQQPPRDIQQAVANYIDEYHQRDLAKVAAFHDKKHTQNPDYYHTTYQKPLPQSVADFVKKGKDQDLNEFAPSDNGGGRKFIPWPEFIDAVKQIVGKDFSCKENVVKSTIKARFVPHDPMEYGPTMLYSYYETRAGGRNKGAVSTRGAIQVGKYTLGGLYGQPKDQLLTGFHLLKGHPFERHFDLTFDNIYKIANIIMGNTEGAYQMPQQQGVAEDYVAEKK